MKYTITYDNTSQTFCLCDYQEVFLGEHLRWIAALHGVSIQEVISESHLLQILGENGIDVELLEEDGSPLDY